MAAVEDAKALQERVWDLAKAGEMIELTALLRQHPEVDVDGYKDEDRRRALYWACNNGHTACARLLIDHEADVHATDMYGNSALCGTVFGDRLSCVKLLVQHGADVNCQNNDGRTPLMGSIGGSRLTIAQYLLEQKADIHYRVIVEGHFKNEDPLFWAMIKNATDRTPGIAFACLSCNTDTKNVKTDKFTVATAIRDAHIMRYQHMQAYIDEYHRILNLVLSEYVPVDPRFGLGQMGIYQEPLERTLEYLGLSMSKDQVVNTSINGEAVRRALIPGHLLNAIHWFQQMMISCCWQSWMV
jgi:hypothetical protein